MTNEHRQKRALWPKWTAGTSENMQKVPGLLAMTWNHLEQWQLTVDDSNHARMIQIADSPSKTSLTIRFVNRLPLISLYRPILVCALLGATEAVFWQRHRPFCSKHPYSKEPKWVKVSKRIYFTCIWSLLYLPSLISVPSWTKRTVKSIIVGLRKVPNCRKPKQPTKRQGTKGQLRPTSCTQKASRGINTSIVLPLDLPLPRTTLSEFIWLDIGVGNCWNSRTISLTSPHQLLGQQLNRAPPGRIILGLGKGERHFSWVSLSTGVPSFLWTTPV